MRVGKHESYFNSMDYINRRSKVRTSGIPQEDKENIPNNINVIPSFKKVAKQGSPLTEVFKAKNPGSPVMSSKQDILRSSNKHNSPPSVTVERNMDGQGIASSGGNRRKRSITPKTLKELLADKRKKLSFSPSPGQEVRRSPPEKIHKPVENPIVRHRLTGSSFLTTPGSPQIQSSPGTSVQISQLVTTRNRQFELVRVKGLLLTTYCLNHSAKMSKFFVVQDEKVLESDQPVEYLRGICSKCAVRLANGGYRVEEIESEEDENIKRTEFNHFIEQVSVVGGIFQLAVHDNQTRQRELFDHYKNQVMELGRVEKIAEELIAFVRRGLADLKQMVESEANLELQKFKDTESTLLQNEKDLKLFETNLRDNFEETVKAMDLEDLQGNIKRFRSRLEELIIIAKNSIETRTSAVMVISTEKNRIREFEESVRRIFKARQDYLYSHRDADIAVELNCLMQQLESHTGVINNSEFPQENTHISFDATQSAITTGSNHQTELRKCSTQQYMTVLDRISESQNKKLVFYETLGKVIKEDEDPLFILTPTEADFTHKQTPELGQKEIPPSHLIEYLAELRRKTGEEQSTVPNLGFKKQSEANLLDQTSISHTGSRLSDLEELFNFIGNKQVDQTSSQLSGKQTSKCQKILFTEQPQGEDEEEDIGLDEKLLLEQN